MTQSVLLVVATALVTWFIMRWARSAPDRPAALSPEQEEAGRAKEIGTQLDGARDRASVVEVERNKLALAKAVKAALWVTESRLNVAVPELLKLAQLWVGQSERRGKSGNRPRASRRSRDTTMSTRHGRPGFSTSIIGASRVSGDLPFSRRRSKRTLERARSSSITR